MAKHLKLIVILALTWSSLRAYAAENAITEATLDLCSADSDCVVVPYSHCCGSTKRAINIKNRAAYEAHPAWQKFDDAKVCAVAGACVSDKERNGAVCVKSASGPGRCQLRTCHTQKVACATHPESSTCATLVCE